jgi:ubiquinone/menaquinone biosynthesis C-methylase UbiE
MAKRRGVEVVLGEAEHLPYRAGSFDFVLMMTVICFLNNNPRAFQETYRVLGHGGTFVAGFIEAGGELFQKYRHEPLKGRFLRFATFRTCDEVFGFFKDAGFEDVSVLQRERGFCVMSGRKIVR